MILIRFYHKKTVKTPLFLEDMDVLTVIYDIPTYFGRFDRFDKLIGRGD